jgi:hypothetical protein
LRLITSGVTSLSPFIASAIMTAAMPPPSPYCSPATAPGQ